MKRVQYHSKLMKIWHSVYHRTAYSGNEPSFYPTEQLPWTGLIESNWQIIRKELEAHLTKEATNQRMNDHGRWKTMPLKTWDIEFHQNIRNFPETMEVLKQIPGLVSISFNLLESDSEIGRHFGETNASIRVHLGLKIPRQGNIGMKVNDEIQLWEEGKILAFCDGHQHEAWNKSEENRYILLLDILRPEFLHKRKSICASVVSTLAIQKIQTKSKPNYYIFFVPTILLHTLTRITASIAIPLHNFFGRRNHRKQRILMTAEA